MDSDLRRPHTHVPHDFAARETKGGEMPIFRAPPKLSRAAPIVCAECGGRAPLIRMSPDSFTRGKTEIWIYECSACAHTMEKTVAAGGAPD
jgi:hypothetical protein